MDRPNLMQGPILRPIQRLGKLGKRSNVPNAEAADPNQTKDPKFVYLSIDECGSHVGNRKTTFFRSAIRKLHHLRLCHCLSCEQVESASVHRQKRLCCHTILPGWLGQVPAPHPGCCLISRRDSHRDFDDNASG